VGVKNREKVVMRTFVAVQTYVRHCGGGMAKTVRLEHFPWSSDLLRTMSHSSRGATKVWRMHVCRHLWLRPEICVK
jgi:hypothetical protein